MVYRGMIKGGGVVLPAGVTLPEGTEVLVALPDQPDEAVIPGTSAQLGRRAGVEVAVSKHFYSLPGTSAELGRRVGRSPTDLPPVPAPDLAPGADHPPGPVVRPEEPRGYPVAEFLSPTEYAWDEDLYAGEEAARAYLSDCHADH
jgi:hypothetical protein